jgi:hypothetical protein
MTMTNDDNDKRDIADACIKKTSLKIPKRMYYCYTVEQERLTFPEHLDTHPQFFVALVLLNLSISM